MSIRNTLLTVTAPIRVPVNKIAKNQEGMTFAKILITIGLVGMIIGCAVLTNYGLRKGDVKNHRLIAYGSFALLYLFLMPIFRYIERVSFLTSSVSSNPTNFDKSHSIYTVSSANSSGAQTSPVKGKGSPNGKKLTLEQQNAEWERLTQESKANTSG